jgi:ubiquinone/menaquinone biosynthesis C-methylase UbiE
MGSIVAVANREIENLFNWFRLQELKRFIGKEKFSLLDLGCGNGSFVKLAGKNKINAWGVDQSSSPSPKIILSNIERLKLKRKFDVVTMYHVLEHTQNPKEILQKAKKFLKRNGVLIIELPLINNLTEKFLKKDYFAYYDPSHLHFFDRKQILCLLQESGFVVNKQGFTLYEFPFTVITASFRKNFLKGILGMVVFIPLKILSPLKVNTEIGRFYCSLTNS